MAKWRRTALGIAGVVAVAAIAAGLALHALVDPARLARQAHDRAKHAWGRELTMGSVQMDFLPRPTLVAQEVVVANPAWAKEHDLLHARRLAARLSLAALLVGKVRVVSVAFEGARVNLEVRDDGAKSWAIGRPAESSRTTPSAANAWADIEDLSIADTQVGYRRASGEVDLWRVDRASAQMDRDLHDVRIDARLERDRHPLHAQGRFADLSRLGQAGATTQGDITLDWGRTRVAAKGEIPLDHGLERATFEATLSSRSLDDMLAFFGERERRTAPIEASAKVSRSRNALEFAAIQVRLGEHRASGDFKLTLGETPAPFAARLSADDLDWGQALLDVGDEKPKPPPEGEMFPARPLPWGMLAAMKGRKGTVELEFGRLLLPDGIELRDASGRATIDGNRLALDPFHAQALGGKVEGTMALDGAHKSVDLALTGSDVLLERWFRERHRPVHFRGGPMKIRAKIHANGESMKALAASMTGPVSILMGPGVYDSKIAGDWEARMVNFAADSKQEIDFECVGAALPFVSGRAQGKDIVGARSRESRLLTSGDIDLREESVDLKGRVRPKPGAGVGLSTIADDIQIAGKIRHMKVRLDPESKPKAIAKGALAIATAGISAVATAASNDEAPDPDPCEKVFSRKGRPPRP
jgi:uncharacterized protein involved in outer membrane biogenesis